MCHACVVLVLCMYCTCIFRVIHVVSMCYACSVHVMSMSCACVPCVMHVLCCTCDVHVFYM